MCCGCSALCCTRLVWLVPILSGPCAAFLIFVCVSHLCMASQAKLRTYRVVSNSLVTKAQLLGCVVALMFTQLQKLHDGVRLVCFLCPGVAHAAGWCGYLLMP